MQNANIENAGRIALSPEELRKVSSLPLYIEWAGWEDDQTADDCQAWDGEHEAANIYFHWKQLFLGKKRPHNIVDSMRRYNWSASRWQKNSLRC